MTRPILNIADVEFRPWGKGVSIPGATNPPEGYEARLGPVSGKIGAQKLGYGLTVLPPGKRAFPAHAHRVNEEMFFVVEGEGEVRIGAARYPIRQGDIIACPPGGADTAHQIVNTSNADLKYLGVSTKLSPEIVEYPDSGKFGVAAESPSADGKQGFRFMGKQGATLNYWDGE